MAYCCAGGIQELISMDISEDMIKRSVLRAAADETAGRVGGAPALQNLFLVGDEEYLPLQPKYVLTSMISFLTSEVFTHVSLVTEGLN